METLINHNRGCVNDLNKSDLYHNIVDLQVGVEKTELECLRKQEGEEEEGKESATFTVQSVQSW